MEGAGLKYTSAGITSIGLLLMLVKSPRPNIAWKELITTETMIGAIAAGPRKESK